MDLSGLKEKINGILESIKGIPKKASGLSSKVKAPKSMEESLEDEPLEIDESLENDEFSENEVLERPTFYSGLLVRLNGILDHFGPERRKLLLIGSGSLIGIFLILLIAAGVSSSKKRRISSPEAAREGLSIAMEELFIPAEPDFVPEFIFERERRRFWSLEDIRPYWRTPDPGDRWREEIKSAVDKLMEGIP